MLLEKRFLSSASFFCHLLLLCSCWVSCGRQYTTVIPAEPLYKSYPKNVHALGEEAEEYVKRDTIQFESEGVYKPLEGESFEEYKHRLFHTLHLQQEERQQQLELIAQKEMRVKDLQQQLQILQKRHIDLRLSLALIMPEQNKHAVADALFMRYTIQPGDTLQKIAYDKLGSYKGWLGLYRFNTNRLSNGPNRIKPNDWIIIPKIDIEKSVLLHEQNRARK